MEWRAGGRGGAFCVWRNGGLEIGRTCWKQSSPPPATCPTSANPWFQTLDRKPQEAKFTKHSKSRDETPLSSDPQPHPYIHNHLHIYVHSPPPPPPPSPPHLRLQSRIASPPATVAKVDTDPTLRNLTLPIVSSLNVNRPSTVDRRQSRVNLQSTVYRLPTVYSLQSSVISHHPNSYRV